MAHAQFEIHTTVYWISYLLFTFVVVFTSLQKIIARNNSVILDDMKMIHIIQVNSSQLNQRI